MNYSIQYRKFHRAGAQSNISIGYSDCSEFQPAVFRIITLSCYMNAYSIVAVVRISESQIHNSHTNIIGSDSQTFRYDFEII